MDEAYNKNLVEEIIIKSFKGYNKGNNFSSNKDSNNCSVFKNTSCCYIYWKYYKYWNLNYLKVILTLSFETFF